jgi:hypothetical protein
VFSTYATHKQLNRSVGKKSVHETYALLSSHPSVQLSAVQQGETMISLFKRLKNNAKPRQKAVDMKKSQHHNL